MASLPNIFLPPALYAAATVAAGLALAFARTRIRARFLIIVDVLVIALAFVPTSLAAELLRPAAHLSRDDSWLCALALVSLPLAYLPLRFTGGRWTVTLAASAALVLTRFYAEFLLAALNTNGLSLPVLALFLLALLCGWLVTRLLPSR